GEHSLRSNGPEGGGQDARHKLPGIRQVKKPVLTDGLFCVCAAINEALRHYQEK
ncbi:hypothetical protein AB7X56_004777, partial [Salmonella enterica]